MKASTIRMGAVSAILIAALLTIPLVGGQNETSYTFTLKGPNFAEAELSRPPSHVVAGDLIRLTGSGTFDTSTGAVSGGGSFEHLKPDGQGGFFVHGKGLWTVKEFVSFTSYDGPSSGRQGGLLIIRVEAISTWSVHWAETGSETMNFRFQVSSLVNAPGGAPAEGVTVLGGPTLTTPLFGIVEKGRTLFHLNK